MRNEEKFGLLAIERQSKKALFNPEEALERSAFGKAISKYENDIKNMFCLNSMCHNSKGTILEDSMYNFQLALLLQLN
jgi:hypothetical protein